MTSAKDLEEHSVAYLKIGYCFGIGLEKLKKITINVYDSRDNLHCSLARCIRIRPVMLFSCASAIGYRQIGHLPPSG
jgi:hypothetical protein